MITRIYEIESVTLDYDFSVPCVIVTPLKFVMPEEFKLTSDFALDFMKAKIKETGKMMYLSDPTAAIAFDEECVKWLIEDWTPRATAAGIKHMGIVTPESEWAKMATEEYSESVKGEGMTTVFFNDIESAKNWFRNMEQ